MRLSTTYLVQRTGSRNWYYREQVPSDVRALLSGAGGAAAAEVWRSTRTADIKEAKTRLSKIRAAAHAEWDAIRAGAPTPILHIPSPSEIAYAVVEHVHELMFAYQTRELRQRVAKGLNLEQDARRNRQRVALCRVCLSKDGVDNEARAAMEVRYPGCYDAPDRINCKAEIATKRTYGIPIR